MSGPEVLGYLRTDCQPRMSSRQRWYFLDASPHRAGTALVYRRGRRVSALAHTSTTGVPKFPRRATGTTTRRWALDRLEGPCPGAIVAVRPRRENNGPGETLNPEVVVIVAPD